MNARQFSAILHVKKEKIEIPFLRDDSSMQEQQLRSRSSSSLQRCFGITRITTSVGPSKIASSLRRTAYNGTATAGRANNYTHVTVPTFSIIIITHHASSCRLHRMNRFRRLSLPSLTGIKKKKKTCRAPDNRFFISEV
jgi:hypothetical protein